MHNDSDKKDNQSNLNDFCEELPEVLGEEYDAGSTFFQIQQGNYGSYKDFEIDLFGGNNYFEAKPLNYSGYYLFDILWLKINGKWNYFLALFDIELDYLVSYEIVESKDMKTLYNFLYKSLYNKKKIAITTDLDYAAMEAINEFSMNHQLSQFHVKEKVKRDIRNYMGANKITSAEEDNINEVMELIFALLNSERKGNNKKLRKKLLKKKSNNHDLIHSLVNELAIPHFKKLTHGKASKRVELTNINKIEHCFKNVFRKNLKRGMKSKRGVLGRFNIVLDSWEISNMET